MPGSVAVLGVVPCGALTPAETTDLVSATAG